MGTWTISDMSECKDEVVEAFDSFLESVEAVLREDVEEFESFLESVEAVASDSFIMLPHLVSAQGRRGVSGRELPSIGEHVS